MRNKLKAYVRQKQRTDWQSLPIPARSHDYRMSRRYFLSTRHIRKNQTRSDVGAAHYRYDLSRPTTDRANQCMTRETIASGWIYAYWGGHRLKAKSEKLKAKSNL